jgi:hypothetical protein
LRDVPPTDRAFPRTSQISRRPVSAHRFVMLTHNPLHLLSFGKMTQEYLQKLNMEDNQFTK